MKNIYFLIITATLFSCNRIPSEVQSVIDKSGSNRKELEKVIEHYKKTKEKQKLEAAYFLISNMEDKFGIYYPESSKFFTLLESVDSLNSLNSTEDKVDAFIKQQIQMNGRNYQFKPQYIKDIHHITAEFLIENIDLAFYVWENNPWATHISFDEFCEWILPYRVNNEPLQNWRKYMLEKLTPVLESTTRADSACLKVNRVIAKDYQFSSKLGFIPYLGGIDAWNNRQGICDHRYQLITMALRSAGIPAAIDFTPHFNRDPMGHSWTVILDSDMKIKSFNGGETWAYLHDTLEVPIGKFEKGVSTVFYRNYFANNANKWVDEVPKNNLPQTLAVKTIKNVSDEYRTGNESSDITFRLKNKKNHTHALLFVFSKGMNLIPISCERINNGKVTFNHVGGDCLYIAGYLSDNQITIDSDPIYLSRKDKTTETYTFKSTEYEKVTLYRKHQVKFMMDLFIRYMKGSRIQGANSPDYSDAVTLYTVNDYFGNYEHIEINNSTPYKYYRFISDTNYIRIAEVNFYNDNNQLTGIIHGKKSDTAHDDDAVFKNAFDNDIRTNFNAPKGSWVGIQLRKPEPLTSFKILARNNFNIVEPGDTYELLYFNKGWYSIETKVATGFSIEFSNVPKGAILLLRNKTKGSEERIFKYEDGKQVWL